MGNSNSMVTSKSKGNSNLLTPKAKELLEKEYAILTQSCYKNHVFFKPATEDMTEWKGYLCAPEGSFYRNATFVLTVKLPQCYPDSAPAVHFDKPVPFHPNVYCDGEVCVDVLTNWSAESRTLLDIMDAIFSMLQSPYPRSSANPEAGKLYDENKIEFSKRVYESIKTIIEE